MAKKAKSVKKKATGPDGIKVKSGRLGDVRVVMNKDRHPAANSKYFALRAQFPNGEETAFLFTAKELERALDRAQKNPEDIPKVPFLLDLLD